MSETDIVDGYLDGFADTRIVHPNETNRSKLYQFGWLNGRDDRVSKQRAPASVLREELRAIQPLKGE